MTAMQRPDAPRHPWLRTYACGMAAVLAVTVGLATAQAPSPQADPELGKRLYRQGILPSGQPLRALVQEDVALAGPQLPCATCHGRSGFGTREGTILVPPITGPALYQTGEALPSTTFSTLYQAIQPAPVRIQVRSPRVRPAYTDETLAIVLRQGKDPTGRMLAPLMPRYHLSDADLRHLSAYLQALSATPSPGVTASAIHFATVITDGVGSSKRQAMLDVLHAYVRWKNADTTRRLQRSGPGAWYTEDFPKTYRAWMLHVWQLSGPPDTWRPQLDAYYQQQPVFALLSGMGMDTWQPVHAFCEAAEVACLFPHTDLPVVEPTGSYTLYLSAGLSVEARALAHHLHTTVPSARIVQVYRDTERSRTPARALRQALPAAGLVHLQDQVIADQLTSEFWQTLWHNASPAILILWLDATDIATLELAPDTLGAVQQIYLSPSLLQEAPTRFSRPLRDKTSLTYPFALPHHDSPHSYRIRAWLRSRGVQSTAEQIQFNTYFALSVADHALMQLGDHFVRDYFIETIEHVAESMPNPGVFPQLTLGPGQRFASKGSYVVRLSEQAPGGLEAVSEWIIP